MQRRVAGEIEDFGGAQLRRRRHGSADMLQHRGQVGLGYRFEHMIPGIHADADHGAGVGRDGLKGGIRHEHVLDPQETLIHRGFALQEGEGLLDQLHIGDIAHGVEHAEQDGPLQQHGQAAAHGVVVFFFHQLSLFLLQALLIVAILLLQLIELGLNLAHFAHALAGFYFKGGQHRADQHGEDDDGDAVIMDQPVDPLQDLAQPYRDKKRIHRSILVLPDDGIHSLGNGIIAPLGKGVAAQQPPGRQAAP